MVKEWEVLTPYGRCSPIPPRAHHMKDSSKIGLTGAVALVIANMMGTGIFTTTGFLVEEMPSRTTVLLAWALGGGLALLGAICYGDLVRQWPESGGEYLFLSRALHPSMGYVAGWVSLFVGFSAPTAAAAYAAGAYARADGFEPDPRWMGTFWIVLFSLCHGKGIGIGGRIQNALVLLKLILLLGVMTWAWTKMEVTEISRKEPFELSTFSVSLVWIYFSYCGWNAAVYIASEVRDPRRQLPLALVAGTLLVTVFYVALNALFLWGVPLDVLAGRENVARVAFDYLGGSSLASMVSFVVLMALLSSISSMTMAGPRVYAKMASDGYLPLWFAKASAPGWACVWLQGGLAISMLWLPTFKQLLSYMGFTLGISASLSILGLMRHKIRYPETIQVTGWPWIPAFFLLIVFWVTLFSIWKEPIPSMMGMLTLFAGWAIWWGRKKSLPAPSA